jgi:thiamine kinase-like enzyme
MHDIALAETLQRIRDLPVWRGDVAPEPLPGGLSNRNFLVRDGADRYVVRLVDGDVPEHGIVRDREIAVSRAAHAAGFAPEVISADINILVLRFIAGRTLTAEDVRAPKMVARIAALLRRCHREIEVHLYGPAPCFLVFHAVRDYLAQLERSGMAAASVDRLRRIAGALERETGPIQPALTHNDLMPGNLIDDGERLWLIDWEYGGYGAPLFDLATLTVNNALDAAGQAHLLAAYHGRAADSDLRHRFAAMVLAARLRETLWARIQETHGRLAYDYRCYADAHEARFEAGYEAFAAQGTLRSAARSA